MKPPKSDGRAKKRNVQSEKPRLVPWKIPPIVALGSRTGTNEDHRPARPLHDGYLLRRCARGLNIVNCPTRIDTTLGPEVENEQNEEEDEETDITMAIVPAALIDPKTGIGKEIVAGTTTLPPTRERGLMIHDMTGDAEPTHVALKGEGDHKIWV